MSDETYKVLNKEVEKGVAKVTIEIPSEVLERFRSDAVKELGQEVEVDGFRKGNAPEKMIIEKVGEMAVIEKAAYKAINNVVPMVITKEELEALTMPSINITKIAPMSALEFVMEVPLLPELELPDYKKIAADVEVAEEPKVEDKEVEEYIDYIRKQRAFATAQAKGEKIDPEKTELPELDDEFVKTLGNFKDVDDFKKQLTDNMLAEKKQKASEARRIQIIENIIDKTKVDLPDVLIDQEVERMWGKFKHDIEQMKMNPDDYLKEVKKTEEELKKEWRPDARKRAVMNLLLPKIAAEEKLKAEESEIEKELEHLKQHDPSIDETHARMYIANVLTNEKVFKLLEEQK